jgi:hypothetical protein
MGIAMTSSGFAKGCCCQRPSGWQRTLAFFSSQIVQLVSMVSEIVQLVSMVREAVALRLHLAGVFASNILVKFSGILGATTQ